MLNPSFVGKATMYKIAMLKKYLNFRKILFPTFVLIFSLLCFLSSIVQQAIGAESQDEPLISLSFNNQPLSDVLKKITSDTGYRFKLNGEWSNYPVNTSFKNTSLNRALKIILQGLNHVIIYESNKSVKIVVYGKVDSDGTGSDSTQPFSSQVQDNQLEVEPSSDSSPAETDDLQREDDNSEETGSSESTEDSSTENEDSSDSGREESSVESDKAVSDESDQDSIDQNENTKDQDDRESTAEDASPESPQEQN
jgi:hypothetical protein